jgi:hypothetical protein
MSQEGGFQTRRIRFGNLFLRTSHSYRQKFSRLAQNFSGAEDFRIRTFLPPRRKDAKFGREDPCHFDPSTKAQDKLREKSFLDPSHSLGMTGLGPSPLRLCGRYSETDRCAKRTLRKPFAFFAANTPNPNFFLLCITIAASLRGSRKFSECSACSAQEGGFKTRPYESRFFFAPFALFAVK